MRAKQFQRIDLLAYWADRGRNDARELGFEKYDGGNEPVYEAAYKRGYECERQNIIDEAKSELLQVSTSSQVDMV